MSFVTINQYFKAIEAMPVAEASKKLDEVIKKATIAKNKIQVLPQIVKYNSTSLAIKEISKSVNKSMTEKYLKKMDYY
jgi:hypothetical protein